MLLSVVTPALNSVRFIRETLDSVLSQGHARMEHIVVDGGSTDGTVELLTEYRDRYPERLRFISEPDRNNCDAMNKGWRLAQGEILCCMGSDDIMPEGTAEYVVRHFLSHPEDSVVYGECDIIDEEGQYIGRLATRDFSVDRSVNDSTCVSFPACFYRKQVVDTVGPALIESLVCDHEFLIRAGKQYPFRRVPRILSHFRLHPGSITGTSWNGAYVGAMYETNRLHHGRLTSSVCRRFFRRKLSRLPWVGKLAGGLRNSSSHGEPWAGKRAIIFGAAMTGHACLAELRKSNKEVLFFIDNSPPPGGRYSGLPVYRPEHLREHPHLDFDVILLATGGRDKDMRNQLRDLGIQSSVLRYRAD